MNKRTATLLLLVLFAGSVFAQSEPSTWVELEFSKKIVKNLKLEFNPELRLFGGFEMDFENKLRSIRREEVRSLEQFTNAKSPEAKFGGII